MGSELHLTFFDNPSLEELKLGITLGAKPREVLGFCLVIHSDFQSMFLFLFAFPLMAVEQFAKSVADDQSSVLQSVIFLLPGGYPA